MIEYYSTRLCFKADIIESLNNDDSFIVHTNDGSFKFTKAEFYQVFPNVIKTESYIKNRYYGCKYPPKRALQFLISSKPTKTRCKNTPNYQTKDFVGDEIRNKIKEIGILWKNSIYNPYINPKILNEWDKLIQEWSDDENMPLIVRKETNKRGMSFIHPSSNREIIISDNTVAIWIFSNVLKGIVFTKSQIKEKLRNKELPIVFMATKEIKKYANYPTALGSASLPDWKLCHIDPIGFNTSKSITELEIDEIKEHFKKYTNPNNMFVLPKEIGYLGEIETFINEQRR